jgi:hypothetical protein
MAASVVRRRLAALGIVAGVWIATGPIAAASPTVIDRAATATRTAARGEQVQTKPLPPNPGPTSAVYRVTLHLTWSTQTHPSTLPPGWHTSPAVLASHTDDGDMFAVGGFASGGIEAMAERGATSVLRNELDADPTVHQVDIGNRVDQSGTDTLVVTATRTAGKLSLVSMLAPSPDWFVGFADVEVFGAAGWVESLTFDLGAYDSGTDSGSRFVSGNVDTQPRQRVSGPRDAEYVAAAGEGRFGFAVIERIA